MVKPLPQFVEYISREVLLQIGDFTLRAMMWVYILRDDGVTFSIIDEWKWFLRTIPETEKWYIEHNCEKFGYTDKWWKTIHMPYHRLPESTYEDIPLLTRLIGESIIAAKIAKTGKKWFSNLKYLT